MEEYDKFEDKGRSGLIFMVVLLLAMITYGLLTN